MDYKLLLKGQFEQGQNKRYEHRQKIAKFLRIVYNRVDFFNWFIQALYLSIVSMLTAILLIFTYAVQYKAYIPNPDLTKIDKIGLASSWPIAEAITYSAIIFAVIAVSFSILGISQALDKSKIKKIIRDNHIPVIK